MIIETRKLSKSFIKKNYSLRNLWRPTLEEKKAVIDFDVTIEEGEIVGFLGPNGAGKTTTLKMLTGIVHPTSGEATVMGYVPWKRDYRYLKQMAIVMGQKNQLWWDLPAIDSYSLLKEVYEIPTELFKKNLDLMVDTLDMKGLLVKRLRDMSLGERMKCELAASFLHDPKVIFLDEPTIGLDVVSAQSVRKFLEAINKKKKCTMILTSHYMGDVEALCKRVVIINQGMKVYDGDLSSLKDKYAPERKIEIYLLDLADREKFAHIKAKDKKISFGKGIIKVGKEEIGGVVNQIYKEFEADKISVSEVDTEEVISKIFQNKKSI